MKDMKILHIAIGVIMTIGNIMENFMPVNLTTQMKQTITKFIHEKIDNINIPIFIKEIECVAKYFIKTKSRLRWFTVEFYQTLNKKKKTLIYINFSEYLKEGNIFQHILWGQHYPDTKALIRVYKEREIMSQCTP